MWNKNILNFIKRLSESLSLEDGDRQMVSSLLTIASSSRAIDAGEVYEPVLSDSFVAKIGEPLLVRFFDGLHERAVLAVRSRASTLYIGFTQNEGCWSVDPSALSVDGENFFTYPLLYSMENLQNDFWEQRSVYGSIVANNVSSALSCINVHPVKIDGYETLGYTALTEHGERSATLIDGYFIKTFDEEKPFFGKYAGNIWMSLGETPSDDVTESTDMRM